MGDEKVLKTPKICNMFHVLFQLLQSLTSLASLRENPGEDCIDFCALAPAAAPEEIEIAAAVAMPHVLSCPMKLTVAAHRQPLQQP